MNNTKILKKLLYFASMQFVQSMYEVRRHQMLAIYTILLKFGPFCIFMTFYKASLRYNFRFDLRAQKDLGLRYPQIPKKHHHFQPKSKFSDEIRHSTTNCSNASLFRLYSIVKAIVPIPIRALIGPHTQLITKI